MKWQDGEPLTARDVAWTFNTIIDNDLSLAIYLKDVEKAVAVDDHAQGLLLPAQGQHADDAGVHLHPA